MPLQPARLLTVYTEQSVPVVTLNKNSLMSGIFYSVKYSKWEFVVVVELNVKKDYVLQSEVLVWYGLWKLEL